MEAVHIEKIEHDLSASFEKKLADVCADITKGIEGFEKEEIRSSPAIWASIGSKHFTLEICDWKYSKDGKVFCYLYTMSDKHGEYFDIHAVPILNEAIYNFIDVVQIS